MPDVINLAGQVGVGYRWRDPAGLDAFGVHHTVSGGDWSGWALERTIDEEKAHALAIDRYHGSLGYGGIGYTDLVFASGRIYRMGPPEQQRAGIGGGHNRHVYSWAFVGNLDLAPPSPAAMLSGGWLIHDIRQRLGRDQATMPAKGHKEFVAGTDWATACPGKLYRQWMPELMLAANQWNSEEDDMPSVTRWIEIFCEANEARALHEEWLASMGTTAEAAKWNKYIKKVQVWRLKENGWTAPA